MSVLQTLARNRNITHARISYIFNNLNELLKTEGFENSVVNGAKMLELTIRQQVDNNWRKKAEREELLPCQST